MQHLRGVNTPSDDLACEWRAPDFLCPCALFLSPFSPLQLLLLLFLHVSLTGQTSPPTHLPRSSLTTCSPSLFLLSFCFPLSLPLHSALTPICFFKWSSSPSSSSCTSLLLSPLPSLSFLNRSPTSYIQRPSLSNSLHTHRLPELLAGQPLSALLLFLSQFQPASSTHTHTHTSLLTPPPSLHHSDGCKRACPGATRPMANSVNQKRLEDLARGSESSARRL